MAKKILIVDDNRAILDALTLVLTDAGYVVTATNNGENIKKMCQDLPDLVILDILLSGHNGADICTQLKSQKLTKHMPIILISAARDTERLAQKAGADDYIAKPFDITTLLTKVAKHTHKES